MAAGGSTATVSEEFAQLADPYRNELLAYCYRMLGSVHDAEDQVQETLLRAWRSYGDFEGRSSIRTWLYRIATNTCLRALETRSRRPLPSGLGEPTEDPDGPFRSLIWTFRGCSRSRMRSPDAARTIRPRSSRIAPACGSH